MKRTLLGLAVLLGLPCARAGAYVDHMSGFTLGYVIEHSPHIVVLATSRSAGRRRTCSWSSGRTSTGRPCRPSPGP